MGSWLQQQQQPADQPTDRPGFTSNNAKQSNECPPLPLRTSPSAFVLFLVQMVRHISSIHQLPMSITYISIVTIKI